MRELTEKSGYKLTAAVAVFATGGVGLTPGAATSRTHFIHHLDPRVNRALYFTWWDRLAGTHTDEHPMCISAPL